ncbi:MAG TPA: hypothetical protein PJ994_05700 [Tepidiformaceae bacterium]|nr:hypothetical protein [Tepidiformaceae bacterium]HMO95125.1 hypothetical protein [Tepidiformaceae bacterium]
MVQARDIPVAKTPPGGWKEMPPPVLAGCDEPLAPGVPDMRGMWKAFRVEENGLALDDLSHRERIEQAGNRVVITSSGIIHDMYADGTLENGVNDVSAVGFQPISVAATFEEGKLVLRPNNAFVAVTRHLEDDVLVWHLLPMSRVTWMRREA